MFIMPQTDISGNLISRIRHMYEARGKKKAAIAFLKDVGVHRPVINTQIPYN